MYLARIERVKLSMKNLRPRIYTDGTGFISEDLALICGNNAHRGERTRDENIETNPSIVELESNLLAMQRQESKAQEPPLLIQFRLFNNGCAVKGTLLVNKKVMSKNFLERVWDPYRHLGISRDASEGEIWGSRNSLLEQYSGHERSAESIEAAFEKILMDSSQQRKKTKLKKKVEESPPWIKNFFNFVEFFVM